MGVVGTVQCRYCEKVQQPQPSGECVRCGTNLPSPKKLPQSTIPLPKIPAPPPSIFKRTVRPKRETIRDPEKPIQYHTLSESEQSVWAALLHHGPQYPGDLSALSKVSVSTIRRVCRSSPRIHRNHELQWAVRPNSIPI
jgi:hypothetical protein